MMKQLFTFLAICIGFNSLHAQVKSIKELDPEYVNWHNQDFEATGVMGTSVDKTYQLKIDTATAKTIIVAVIDGGVDIEHEDLQGKIWVNEDEIPGNGIDDDQNGYIDDIHGWNFIGNAQGENILHENLEYTRMVRDNDANDPYLNAAKERFKKEYDKKKFRMEQLEKFEAAVEQTKTIIEISTGIAVNSKEDLKQVVSMNPQVNSAKKFLWQKYDLGFTDKGLEELMDYYDEYLSYFLNTEYDVRSLVGDDPFDFSDRSYGNPDVKGPRSDHGTFVAGIIAANRDNGIGMNGIATNVKIMPIRCVPNGDERDKDIALGIIYAVNNGAQIINMSFGKDFSPQKSFVDEAVKFAEENGVLLIHAAGNDGENVDYITSYPSDFYADKTEATNFMNVGASTKNVGKELVADFSNYGYRHVDIFAPGDDIVSTDSSSTYDMLGGTSFAAPVVSGIAALLLSHYRDLKPSEVIEILMQSAHKVNKPKKVLLPYEKGVKRKKVEFETMSKCGGIVNAYNAFLLAEIKIRDREVLESKTIK